MMLRRTSQSGAAMLVSLILLVIMTLLAVTTLRLNKGNLQIVGNMQDRNQAYSAAQATVEEVISSPLFTTSPTNAINNPCNGVANTKCVDVNGDGVADVNVVVTPTCVSTQAIPTASLNYNDPNDIGCLVGVAQDFGTAGATSNNSLCSNNVWDIQSVATDVISSAKYVVHQGITMRDNNCP